VAVFAAIVSETLASGVSVRFRADGDSMHPAIRSGDVITVAPVTVDHIALGDVLLCRHGAHVLVHRLVAVTGRGDDLRLLLRGDGTASCDTPVAAPDLLGRLEPVERPGRAIALGRAAIVTVRRAVQAAALRVTALVRSHG
jgi:hypothetical protein